MIKNRRSRRAQVLRLKRRFMAKLCNQVVTAYRRQLADAPEAALAATRRRKAARLARITAERKAKQTPAPAPFFIGGAGA